MSHPGSRCEHCIPVHSEGCLTLFAGLTRHKAGSATLSLGSAGFGFIQPDDAAEEPEGAAQHDLFVHQVRKAKVDGCGRRIGARRELCRP